jgi:hypothetical protein
MAAHAPDDSPLIALSDAARLVYHACTGKLTDNAKILNNIARAIAMHTQVFSLATASAEPVLVWPNEFMEGTLELGGAYLEFYDERAPLGYLSIVRSELPKVTEELRNSFRDPDHFPGRTIG